MAQTVIGMFQSSEKAQNAVQELVQSGISRDRIDVSASNTTGSSSSAGSSYSSSATASNDDRESGVSKFFKSLFGDDDDDADKYTSVASRAQSIVTVHAQSGDEAEKVADILDDNGAVDVDEHATSMGYKSSGGAVGAGVAGLSSTGISDTDYPNTTLSTGATTGTGLANDITGDETSKIPIIEENLAVGKREVTTGGVRLRSRIVERPVEESLRLREERVSIERNTVNRAATADDLANFQEKNIEMVERAEVPVVSKEARVVEEVSLGKTVEERSETIKDTVRKTEVDVENIESNNLKDKFTNNDL